MLSGFQRLPHCDQPQDFANVTAFLACDDAALTPVILWSSMLD